MKKGATTLVAFSIPGAEIIALRNEKGSYNNRANNRTEWAIIALRNEKGSYNIYD